jgi:hypothetical protein
MEVKERYVKLGKFPVKETIPVDGGFSINVAGEETLHFECVKVEHKSNQDGTIDEIYILKHRPY